MEIQIDKLLELIEEKFNNNQTLFAQTIGIERTHLNKVLRNNGKGAGALFCGALIKYCNENNLNYEEYIFLTKNVNKFTKNISNKNVVK